MAADLIHDVPETWSDERMHILGDPDECWCDPVVDGLYLRHQRPADPKEPSP